MPGPPREHPAPARRLDPLRALDDDPLAAPLQRQAAASPLEHLRARDPRARLEAASQQLHGARAALPDGGAPDEPAPPRRRLDL
jgi:hypothetical protein